MALHGTDQHLNRLRRATPFEDGFVWSHE